MNHDPKNTNLNPKNETQTHNSTDPTSEPQNQDHTTKNEDPKNQNETQERTPKPSTHPCITIRWRPQTGRAPRMGQPGNRASHSSRRSSSSDAISSDGSSRSAATGSSQSTSRVAKLGSCSASACNAARSFPGGSAFTVWLRSSASSSAVFVSHKSPASIATSKPLTQACAAASRVVVREGGGGDAAGAGVAVGVAVGEAPAGCGAASAGCVTTSIVAGELVRPTYQVPASTAAAVTAAETTGRALRIPHGNSAMWAR